MKNFQAQAHQVSTPAAGAPVDENFKMWIEDSLANCATKEELDEAHRTIKLLKYKVRKHLEPPSESEDEADKKPV